MGTLAEEILGRKLGRTVRAGEIVLVEADAIMSHDNTTPLAIRAFRGIGKPILFPERIYIHFDHAYPAPNPLAAENHRLITAFVREQGLRNFYRKGVCHQVMIEEGAIRPGGVVIGGDSHSVTYGALGCFSTGMGSSEIGASWVTGKTWFRVPETIHVILEGSLQPGVYAKDIMLHIAGRLGVDGATYKSLEFSGPALRALPMHERIIFANMSVELGAKCGLIEADETTFRYLEAETKAKGPFESIKAEHGVYVQELAVNVSKLEPLVACHPQVDQVRSLSELEGMGIDQVFIGTCTNARYEDLALAASILKGHQVSPFTRVIVTPASQTIYERIMREGILQDFLDAGCTVTAPGCGACIGRHGGVLANGEKAFTTMNRNFLGRMGNPNAEIYLGSPAAAAAAAIEGRIADPRKYVGSERTA